VAAKKTKDQQILERIERRWQSSQKVNDGDLRWMFKRIRRLHVADQILEANGYVIDEPGYQQPIQEKM